MHPRVHARGGVDQTPIRSVTHHQQLKLRNRCAHQPGRIEHEIDALGRIQRTHHQRNRPRFQAQCSAQRDIADICQRLQISSQRRGVDRVVQHGDLLRREADCAHHVGRQRGVGEPPVGMPTEQALDALAKAARCGRLEVAAVTPERERLHESQQAEQVIEQQLVLLRDDHQIGTPDAWPRPLPAQPAAERVAAAHVLAPGQHAAITALDLMRHRVTVDHVQVDAACIQQGTHAFEQRHAVVRHSPLDQHHAGSRAGRCSHHRSTVLRRVRYRIRQAASGVCIGVGTHPVQAAPRHAVPGGVVAQQLGGGHRPARGIQRQHAPVLPVKHQVAGHTGLR